MAIALPGSRGLFIQMQEALRHLKGGSIALTRGVHQALTDLRWLAKDLSKFPTRQYELVLLHLTMDGYHDTYGYVCGGT